ncbi:MAG: hypothetical protein SNG38_06160 [Rikenellaceae bacterium]
MCKKNIDKDYEKARNCKMSIILIIIIVTLAAIFLSVIYIDVNYYLVINSGKNICHGNSDMMANYILIMLACITLTFAVSALVPYFISKNSIKNEMDNLFKEEYKIGLNNSINSLDETDAHHSRMMSVLLTYNEKYIWSIGWMCRAIIRYSRINKPQQTTTYNKYKNISKICIPLIVDNIIAVKNEINIAITNIDISKETEKFKEILTVQFNSDNTESDNTLIIRSLKDLIDCRIASSDSFTLIETQSQTAIINAFITLVVAYLTEDEIAECERLSKYKSDKRFNKEISKYRGEPYYMRESPERGVSNDIWFAFEGLKNAAREYETKK